MKDFLAKRVTLPVWVLVLVGMLLLGLGASSGSSDDGDVATATAPAAAIEDQLPFAETATTLEAAPATTAPPATTPPTTAAPSTTVPPTTATTVATSPPTTQQETPMVVDVEPAPTSGTYFANCSAARAAGAAPVRRGDPGYAPHLDRDNDGVGCE